MAEAKLINFFKDQILSLCQRTREEGSTYKSRTFLPFFEAVDLSKEEEENLCEAPADGGTTLRIRENN